jgi:hypothetical protein
MICRLPGHISRGLSNGPAREYAVLLHGSGDEGLQMLNASYRLSVGGFSLVGKAIQSGKTQFVITNRRSVTVREPFFAFLTSGNGFRTGQRQCKNRCS